MLSWIQQHPLLLSDPPAATGRPSPWSSSLVIDVFHAAAAKNASKPTNGNLSAALQVEPALLVDAATARLHTAVTLAPFAWLAAYLVIFCLPWPRLIPRRIKTAFRTLTHDVVSQADLDTYPVLRDLDRRKAVAIIFASAARLAIEVARLVSHLASSQAPSAGNEYGRPATILLISSGSLTWLAATVFTVVRPPATPDYGLLLFYTLDVLSRGYALLAPHVAAQPLPSVAVIQMAISINLISLTAALPMSLCYPSPDVPRSTDEATRNFDSPEDGTTLASWLLVNWMNPLLALAKQRTLNDTDVWQLSPFFRHHIIFPVFCKLPQKRLLWKLYAFTAHDIAIGATCSIASAVLGFSGPFFLKLILEALSSSNPELRRSAYNLALFMFLLSVLRAEVDLIKTWHSRRSYERVRGVLITTVFDKATRKKDTSGSLGHRKLDKDEHDVPGAESGRIMNLMNGDAYAVAQWIWEISAIIETPIKLVVAVFFLYQFLGWSAIAGLSSILLTYASANFLFKRNIALQRELYAATDRRISVMSELVTAIRFLKYYAWEKIWIDKAIEARENELSVRYRSNWNSVFIIFTFMISPTIFVFTTFLCFTKIAKHELGIPLAFASSSVFGMAFSSFVELPNRVIFYMHTLVSIGRLEKYLNEPELSEHAKSPEIATESESEPQLAANTLGFVKATLQYPQHEVRTDNEPLFQLRCPTFTFPEGELTVVSGENASGKSSLLLALLGEMDCIEGSVVRPARTNAFAISTQDAWLEQNTILENIVFGEPFDEDRFDQVVEACALKPDLARWEAGEHTEIGERGISLSGGQRARVALARCAYSQAPCVLLDDPYVPFNVISLSAVDAHTARHLVDNCLGGTLMKGRTVVLVTHHVRLCSTVASMMVRMSAGTATIEDIDTDLVAKEGQADDASQEDSEGTAAGFLTPKDKTTATTMTPVRGRLISTENRAEGSVKWLVYSMFLKAAGYETWIGILCLLFIFRGLTISMEWFMKAWGESYDSDRGLYGLLPSARDNVNPWLAVYLGLSVTICSSIMVRYGFSYHGSFKAARSLLYACLLRVTHAPSRWLDENPTGRLLNRFTADIGSVDSTINNSVIDVANDVIGFIGALGGVLVVVPRFGLFALIAILLFTFLSSPYVRASRDLRRLENNHRSPLFSRFGGLLRGLRVVRAFGQQKRYVNLLNSDLDMFQSMDHFFWTARFWLKLRLDFVGALAIYTLMLIALAGGVSQGSAAFAIVLAQTFVNALNAACWSYAKLELDVNSIERIHDLLETVQESPAIIPGSRPPAHWPAQGQVVIEDLTVRYASHLPLALHGVSVTIEPGQKVGIVGRTGSGKTTLALSLLRITEPEAGAIFIDGIDISKIGLKDLRERITIISQESTLFEGTIRSNLDPMGEHQDFDIWDVLSRVGMARDHSLVASSSEGDVPSHRHVASLDAQVTAGAENFSQGERQLLSIARALLRRSNVYIADEATASVDFATDEKVQQTLRKELAGATVITIAHRLRTIIDADRIVLLQDGVVKEYGDPRELLNTPDSAFRELCQQSNELEELTRIALASRTP